MRLAVSIGSCAASVGRWVRTTAGFTWAPHRDGPVALGLLCWAVLVPSSAPLAVAVALVAGAGPPLVAARRRAAAQQRRAAEAADTVPLLRVACDGGLSARGALTLVAPLIPGGFGVEVRALLHRVDRGRPLGAELAALGGGDSVSAALVTLLVAAERDGAPLRDTLARLDNDVRAQRRRDLDAAANRLTVRIVFPLVVTVLPGFVLLAVVPMLVTSLQRLDFG